MVNCLLAEDDPEKRRIRKRTIAALANDDQVHGRDDEDALVTRSDGRDKITRCVPAKTDVMPILSLPRDIQHLFNIDLAGAIPGRPINPEPHPEHRIRATATEQLCQHTARNDLAVIVFPLVENKNAQLSPLSAA